VTPRIDFNCDTICFDRDTPAAVVVAVASGNAFARAGVGLVPMARLLDT
jgi:hypothetical protein